MECLELLAPPQQRLKKLFPRCTSGHGHEVIKAGFCELLKMLGAHFAIHYPVEQPLGRSEW